MIAKLSSLLAARLGPSAASVLVHVVAITAIGGHALSTPAAGDSASVTTVDIVSLAEETPVRVDDVPVHEEAASVARGPALHAGGAVTHTHAYPVAPDHDAHPHDAAQLHTPWGAPPPTPDPDRTVAATPVAAPLPQFTMTFNGATAVATTTDANADRVTDVGGNAHAHASAESTHPHGLEGAGPAAAGQGAVDAKEPVVAESLVSRPARILSRAPLTYPAEASAAEVEADVPLELVVDTHGAVIEARVVRRVGLGFDAAALSAVRRYRFSPAERDGRPVRVRMRWSVEFQLR